mmetsp:Transcript_18306/g.29527  ORF Transcript_18306/g.29527 Transcript_18306/m.29527 type:complete len:220 (+) Transcript_18306:915-1574(+)
MYSDMSIRIRASSLSNINSLSALQSSVLPTPVGPRKIKEAIGLLGSLRPARERWTASVTTWIASSWPTTRSLKLSAMLRMRFRSLSSNLLGGIPVHVPTTAAISSATTSSRSMRSPSCRPSSSARDSRVSSSSMRGGSLAYFSSAALLRSNSRSHFSISSSTSAISLLISLMRSTPPFSAIHFKLSSCCCLRRSSNSWSIPDNRVWFSFFSFESMSSFS